MRAAVVNPPSWYLKKLDPLPAGTRLLSRPTNDLDFVQVFARDAAELRRLGRRAIRAAKPGGILWSPIPRAARSKQSPTCRRPRGGSVLGEITGETGYKPVAFAKIDETWTTTLCFKKVGAVLPEVKDI